MKLLAFTLLLIGFLVTGIVATGTAMTFQWPGYVLLGAAAFASVGTILRGKASGVSSTCLSAGLLMTVFVMGRAMTSPVIYFAREDAALAVACFCVYALAAVVFSRGGWRMGLFWALVALVVVNLGFGIYQQLFDMKRWIFEGYMRTYENRIGGVFNNPNHFAALLALSVPIFLSVALFGKNYAMTIRLLLGFLSFMSLVAIGASKSRGGLLAVGAGLCVFALIAFPRIWARVRGGRAKTALMTVVAVVVVGIGAITVLNLEMIGERFGSSSFSRQSEMNRPLMWRAALDQNAESPLFGTGSRTFYFFSRKYRSPQMHVSVPEADFAHNEYFQMLADYGWIGLVVAGAMMLVHFENGLRYLQKRRRHECEAGAVTEELGENQMALAIGALAGLTAILVHACFDFVLHVPILALTTSIFLGILAVPGQVLKTRPPSVRKARYTAGLSLLTRALCPGVGLALIVFGGAYSQSERHFELARLRYTTGGGSLEQINHLRRAQELDPGNPFAHSLGAQAYVDAITPDMSIAVQDSYLEKAEAHYRIAQNLYPQDIFAAIGFAEVLDSLGKTREAEIVLLNARKWAPLYGPVMHAQADHWMAMGNLELAETYFNDAREAAAFRDWRAAVSGLEQIVEIRKVAVNRQIDAGLKIAEDSDPVPIGGQELGGR